MKMNSDLATPDPGVLHEKTTDAVINVLN